MEYNSLILISQKDFIIAPEKITLDELIEVHKNIKLCLDLEGVPFPQADRFVRIIDLLGLLYEKDLTREEITQNYDFDERQTNYHTDAGRYLGLIKKYKDSETKEIAYTLTSDARIIMGRKYKAKYLSFVEKILKHEVFYKVFEITLQEGKVPDKNKIIEVMLDCRLNERYNINTIDRRSVTVRWWINWIVSLIH